MEIQDRLKKQGMLETIIFGAGYGEKKSKRKDIRDSIRKNGFLSTFCVENFHFPPDLVPSSDERKDIEQKSMYFVEKADIGIWLFWIGGDEKGAVAELCHLKSIFESMPPRHSTFQEIRKLRYGIFVEEKGGARGDSPVLTGYIPENAKIYVEYFKGIDELVWKIYKFVYISYEKYKIENQYRLNKRSLPFPKCEFESKTEVESKINQANFVCLKEVRWICYNCLKIDSGGLTCPICRSEIIGF